MMELPCKESTGFGKGRRDTAGFSFLTTAMGANVESDGSLAGEESKPAMNRFTGKPYDEDLQADVFPFRNYSAKLVRWTSAEPAGFPDGPNRHFYAPVPTERLDPLGLATLVETINPGDPFDSAWSYGKVGSVDENGAESILYRQHRGRALLTEWVEVASAPTGSPGDSDFTVQSQGSVEEGLSFQVEFGWEGSPVDVSFGVDASGEFGIGMSDSPPDQEIQDDQYWQAAIVFARADIQQQTRQGWGSLPGWPDGIDTIHENTLTQEWGIQWKLYEN